MTDSNSPGTIRRLHRLLRSNWITSTGANTAPNGAEACAICHGEGEDFDVRTVHTVK